MGTVMVGEAIGTGAGDYLDPMAQGLKVRREVLGDAYVDAAMANADEFARPLQELISRYCWGEVWSRDGLDRRTRSLLNLAMLSALNRPHELKLHLQGAFNNGCSEEDVREVILQAAIYCGVPAALDAMRIAKGVIAERRSEA
jgi:4-carboxymuconolactone decarboxylase